MSEGTGKMTKLKQVILGAQFPGVNNFTVWSDPAAGSQIEFSSFKHFAETVERGKFDFIFLAEGLRVREQKGKLHELDVAGRPNTLAILTALAAITENVGLIGTLTTTFNEPYALARQLATFDTLSGGRAGWLECGDIARRVYWRKLPAWRSFAFQGAL